MTKQAGILAAILCCRALCIRCVITSPPDSRQSVLARLTQGHHFVDPHLQPGSSFSGLGSRRMFLQFRDIATLLWLLCD